MKTRLNSIRYCTNCRQTTHVTSCGLDSFSCDRCGATLYPFHFMPPDNMMEKRENADEKKRLKQGDLPSLRP